MTRAPTYARDGVLLPQEQCIKGFAASRQRIGALCIQLRNQIQLERGLKRYSAAQQAQIDEEQALLAEAAALLARSAYPPRPLFPDA
jgi:hypothetical protein